MQRLCVLPLWAIILVLTVQIAVRLSERHLSRPTAVDVELREPTEIYGGLYRPSLLSLDQDGRQLAASIATEDLDNSSANESVDVNTTEWNITEWMNHTNGTNDSNGTDVSMADSDSTELTNTTTSTTFTITSSTGTSTSKTLTTSTDTTVTSTSSTATSTSRTVTTSTATTVTTTSSTATTSTATSTSSTATTSTSSSITRTSTSLTRTSSTSTTISSTRSTTSKTSTLTTATLTSTLTFTSTSSTTSTTTIWGDVIIALDFNVDAARRDALMDFAEDVVQNVTANAGGFNVSFGLLLFGAQDYDMALDLGTPPADFLMNLRSAGGGTFVARGTEAATADALGACSVAMNRRIADVSIVVVVTNSASRNSTRTEEEARRLKFQGIAEVIVIAVAMDVPDQRTAERQGELEEMATSADFEYDAYYDQVGSAARRLRSQHPRIPLSELAEQLVPQFSEVLFQITPTEIPESSSGGVTAGVVLLTALGGLCCFSAVAAVSFLACKHMQEAEVEESRKLSAVVPAGSDAPSRPEPKDPAPRPNFKAPEPDDDVQLQIKAAMGAQDLRRLRKLLSEILLKGYPPKKYHALVLKALDWVEAHKNEAEASLKKAMCRKVSAEVNECAVDARLCGVDDDLLQQAAHVTLQLSPGCESAGSLY